VKNDPIPGIIPCIPFLQLLVAVVAGAVVEELQMMTSGFAEQIQAAVVWDLIFVLER
jgi:hypothetical protein